MRDWFIRFTRRIEITPEASAHLGIDVPGILQADARVQARLQQDESFVAEMNRLLSGRISELSAQADQVIGGIRDQLRQKWAQEGTDWRGLVLVFDSLDHVRGTDFTKARRALQDLFDLHLRTLALESVRTVLVVPQWLSLNGPPIRRTSLVLLLHRAESRAATGDAAGARQDYQRALEYARDDQEALSALGALHNLAAVAQAWDEAEDWARRAQTVAQRLADQIGGPQELRDLSVSLNKVGDARAAQGDWPAAETAYRAALELLDRLAEAGALGPGNESRRGRLRRSLHRGRPDPGADSSGQASSSSAAAAPPSAAFASRRLARTEVHATKTTSAAVRYQAYLANESRNWTTGSPMV